MARPSSSRPPSRANTPHKTSLPVELLQLVYTAAQVPPENDDDERVPLPLARVRRHLDALYDPQRQGIARGRIPLVANVYALAERYKVEADSNEILGEQLESTLHRLFPASERDEGLLRPDRVPDALQFLLALASPPTSATLDYARVSSLRDTQPTAAATAPTQVDWKTLVAGYAGEQDWAPLPSAYTIPAESSSEDEETNGLSSNSSSNSGNDEDDFPLTPDAPRTRRKQTRSQPIILQGASSVIQPIEPDFGARLNLIKEQYWDGSGPTSLDPHAHFKSGDPSTLMAGLQRVGLGQESHERHSRSFWSEVEIYRDVLGALQGRRDAGLFVKTADGYKVSSRAPSLLHLSTQSLHSLLASFTPTLDLLKMIDRFLRSTILVRSITASPARSTSIDAFAYSVNDMIVRPFRKWCISLESDLLSPLESSTISLLGLANQVQDRQEPLLVITDLIRRITSFPSTSSSLVTSDLLDNLQERIDHYRALSARAIEVTLIEIWCATATPLWASLGAWIRFGRLVPRRNEQTRHFFVSENEELDVADAGYYQEGYIVDQHVPRFLKGLAQAIVGCGKAKGLSKVIGAGIDEEAQVSEWPNLRDLVERSQHGPMPDLQTTPFGNTNYDRASSAPPNLVPFSQSLTLSIEQLCLPTFEQVHLTLHRTIIDECRLDQHLSAVQGVFLMRDGKLMDDFISDIFHKMDRRLPWSDYHTLNSAWTRASAGHPTSSFIRVRSKTQRFRTSGFGALKRLHLEYDVPWPLNYIITPSSLDTCSRIFTVLLCIQRARHVLDQTILLKLDPIHSIRISAKALRSYLALKSRLGWCIRTLQSFFMCFIIESEVRSFKDRLDTTKELDGLIELWRASMGRLKTGLLLNDSAEGSQEALYAILDLGVELSGLWTEIVDPLGKATTRHSTTKRHRRRVSTLDSSDEEDQAPSDDSKQTPAKRISSTLSSDSFADRLMRMDQDLSTLVEVLRTSVYELTREGKSSHEREVLDVLSGVLEQWKN
ncbi:BZ3500_MvSof-1268-A1-R1_Chr4-2g07072 [Microbotryum saponariae]|uniref:Spindle pole body component n=1 Tax=Microbotryum saponariae TaxID=289078 RepID=A0A2X0KZ34_9BASI|nr:BZ3500_MvSof-1268-A1-R1_Chr4-2g07072 [Microbotryum saponariae]SDA06737.1 BZ3501_MvSof-1269-A2-R1_Chr4-2g06783 [Microbotryum saponariae]